MTDAQAVPPPALTAMLASRYSAQVQPRDLDVANIAAAARQKAIARLARRRADEYESEPEAQSDVYCYEAIALRKFADLLDGGTDGQ